MAVFRTEFIQPDTIGMIPVHGYVNRTKFSADAIRWMECISKTDGLDIRHALNGLGEKKINGISVDGFHENSNTIYQYHVSFIKQRYIYIYIYIYACDTFLLSIYILFIFVGLLFSWMHKMLR